MENTIGKPLEFDVCLPCWDSLTKKKINNYLNNGVVPITRNFVSVEWKQYCAKYGLRP